MDRKRALIYSEGAELAVKLVKLLDRNGVTALWVTQEQGEEIEHLWRWDARIRQVQGDRSLSRGTAGLANLN
jgi:hypothetical protein